MSTVSTAAREELIGTVRALYRRLAAGELNADDVLGFGQARFPDLSAFMHRVYADDQLFEEHFSSFADTYDVFRIFGRDSVVLDVGAHWGYSALAMRRRGTEAQVFSIEAMPQNAQVLAVLKALEGGRYDFVECAATERVEELTFYIPAMNGVANTGSSSTGGALSDFFAFIIADLAKVNPAPPGKADLPQLIVRTVAGKPIDLIAAERGLTDRVRAIKMDVEGHEASALRGARALLGAQRPLIMVEGANRDPGVVRELSDAGYLHHVRHEGRLVRHDAFSEANDGFWAHPSRLDEYGAAGLI